MNPKNIYDKVKRKIPAVVGGLAVVAGLAGCEPEFKENRPVQGIVQGMYAGMEAVAYSGSPKFVQLRSKENNFTIFAFDGNNTGVFDEGEVELRNPRSPPLGGVRYTSKGISPEFEFIKIYLNPDSLEAVYNAVIGGNQ